MPKSLVEDKMMLRAFLLFVVIDAIVFGVVVAFVLKQPPQQSAAPVPSTAKWQSLDVVGQEYFDKGQLTEAQLQFEASLRLAQSVHNTKLEIASLNELADLAAAKGDLKQRQYLLSKVGSLSSKSGSALLSKMEEARMALKAQAPIATAAITDLCEKANDAALNSLLAGDYQVAIVLATKTKELADAALPANMQVKARCVYSLGSALEETGDFKGAILLLKQALEFTANSSEPFGTLMASSYYDLGRAYLNSNQPVLAEKNLGVALQMFRQLIGPRSREVANCKVQLAMAYELQGERDKAIESARNAIDICEDKTQVRRDVIALATAYTVIARAKNHLHPIQRALKLTERQIIKPYQLLCEILVNTSELSVSSSPDQAQALLNRAVAISKRFADDRSRLVDADLSYVQGRIHFCKGEFALSKDAFEQALVARRNYYGSHSPHCADVLTNIAMINSLSGKVDLAGKSFEEAASVLARCNKKDGGYPEASALLKKEYGDWLIKVGRSADADNIRKIVKWSRRYNEQKAAES